jgi:hypothetical protein
VACRSALVLLALFVCRQQQSVCTHSSSRCFWSVAIAATDPFNSLDQGFSLQVKPNAPSIDSVVSQTTSRPTTGQNVVSITGNNFGPGGAAGNPTVRC